jgi:hypothetical protein
MSRNLTIVAVAACLILAGTGYVVWLQRSSHSACDACLRPIHLRSKTVGLVDGKTQWFCCPACALTAHRQTGKAVQIRQLTDFETDTVMSPASAFIVVGSDTNHCTTPHAMADPGKQPSRLAFDRCNPSMIAFGGKSAAENFIARHGGALHRFTELEASYRQ